MSKKLKTKNKKLDIKDYEIALSYCRVSSEKQKLEGSGLDSQEIRNEQLAKQHNFKIEKVFLDTASGGGDFMKRPAMRELLLYLDKHPYKKYAILFDDLKRLARDTEFHFKLRTALSARNALPICSNFVFGDEPEDKFVETIQAAHNQLEREQNKRQVIQKQKACLERGYWAFHPLCGYKKVKMTDGKKDVPNEQNKYIKELFEGFFSGRFQQFIDGASFLKEVKVFGKQSAEKYITSVKSILTQPFYAGFIEFPAWEVTRRKGIHEPTVSLEMFEAVQNKINRPINTTKIRQDVREEFPLRQLVNCAFCNHKLTAAWSQGKRERYPYYFCQTKDCPLKSSVIRKKDIEEKFKALLLEMTTDDDVTELAKVIFERAKEKDKKECVIEAVTNEKRKQECETEINTYLELAAKAKIPLVISQYESKIEKLADELNKLKSDGAIEYDYAVPYQTALDKMLGILKNPYSIWEKVNVFEKQKFFSFLFEVNLLFDKIKGYQTPKYTVLKRVCSEIEPVGSAYVEMGGIEPPCK